MPVNLEKALTRSFGSIHALRDTLLSTASGMFGPGFVWLVQEENPSELHPATEAGTRNTQLHFRIMTTYLAGTPYPKAHMRQQGLDMNVHNLQSAEEYNRQNRVQNRVGAFGRASAFANAMGTIGLGADGQDVADSRQYGGAEVIPILCVNTWEHCYLHDFGVAGKRNYLATWWDHIDWRRADTYCRYEQMLRS